MTSDLDSTQEFKKFLNKLLMILKNEPVFALGKIRLYDKSRIDDIICCIESSIPENYKILIKNKVARRLETYQIYIQLNKTLKQKFPLSSSIYRINLAAASALINGLVTKIDADIKFIINNIDNIH